MRKTFILTLCCLIFWGGFILYQYLYRMYYISLIEPLTLEREIQTTANVSVVMTTYNRVKLLPRSIESILSQTFEDFDFIIIDDGSTDSSLKLLYDYMLKDKRIRVYPNDKNRGISYSRNRLLSLIKAPYYAMTDSDDYSYPTRLEKQFDYLQTHPDVDIVTSQTTTIDQPHQLSERWIQKEEELADYFLRKCPISNSSPMLRTQFVKQNKLAYSLSLSAGEDYDFWVQALEKKAKFAIISEPLSRFWWHNTNSDAYYDSMGKTIQTVQKKLCDLHGVLCTDDILDEPYCERLKRIAQSDKKFFTQEQISYALTQNCPTEQQKIFGYFIVSLDKYKWSDYFIQTDIPNLLVRFKTQDAFYLVSHSSKQIIVESPAWGRLIFVPQKGTTYWVLRPF